MDQGFIRVMDLYGNILLQQQYTGAPLDLSALPKGIYLIQIQTDNRWTTRKVLKE